IEAEGKAVKLFIGSSSVLCDGWTVQLEAAPRVVGGRTFVPLRFVSEHLGAAVKWDPQKGQVRVYKQSLRPLRLRSGKVPG
ncbi:MAG: copper amine oxidase N-terminal domain-containing protein, partial [Clostridia bacterium]|nr:copper amine oxidase N-terminal domain-containing protein [Clostridia bacterium]